MDASGRAVLVRNSFADIEACKGKLELKLIRIWGGSEEQDIMKFFKTPISVAADKERVFICDQHDHCIKVFQRTGKYVRTIGRRGRGPGDLFIPITMALSPQGDLVVFEFGGYRIQRFSPGGKSKRIIKRKGRVWWLGVTSKDQLAVYNQTHTFQSRKLISIVDQHGTTIKEIGQYHDKARDLRTAEKLLFTIDRDDYIYAVNRFTPLIRKYSPEGELLTVSTFVPPFEIPPVKISLNSTGDEIIREEPVNETVVKIIEKNQSVTIQKDKQKSSPKVLVIEGIGADSQGRAYVVTPRRFLTKEEASATHVHGGANGLRRDKVNFDIVENIDFNRLLVFDSKGKVVAETGMTTFCNGIHVHENRIFVIDGTLNQRVLEYEMSFVD